MYLLTENFRLFTLCGCWMPESLKNSKCKSILYSFYSLTILILTIGMLSMKIINVTSTSYKNIQKFAITIYGLAEFISSTFKFTTITLKREQIFETERTFFTCFNNSNNKEEIEILQHFNKICRLLKNWFPINATTTFLFVISLFYIYIYIIGGLLIAVVLLEFVVLFHWNWDLSWITHGIWSWMITQHMKFHLPPLFGSLTFIKQSFRFQLVSLTWILTHLLPVTRFKFVPNLSYWNTDWWAYPNFNRTGNTLL